MANVCAFGAVASLSDADPLQLGRSSSIVFSALAGAIVTCGREALESYGVLNMLSLIVLGLGISLTNTHLQRVKG